MACVMAAIGRKCWRAAIVLLACATCAAAGVAIFLALAFLTASVWLLLTLSLLAFAVVGIALAWVLARRWRTSIRNLSIALIGLPAVITVLYAGVVELTLPPLRTPPPNVSFWHLPDGYQVAYRYIPGASRASEPIIFVHGGPGVSDLEGDSQYFGQLARLGHGVYVYDQVGAGFSSRLHNPVGYTVARDVQDLAEIRRIIGAPRVILIGHSYGAAVATYYAARYPGHVSKLILSSPGPLPTGLSQGGFFLQRNTTVGDTLNLFAHILEPRALLTYSLLQISPQAAHNFSGDATMDRRFDAIYPSVAGALHCPGKNTSGKALTDLGFYANQTPQSARSTAGKPPASPASVRSPVLVIKGRCDYLSWESAIAYKRALTGTSVTLVYLPEAGHNAYQDQPTAYLSAVSNFIEGKPVPHTYRASTKPKGYGD